MIPRTIPTWQTKSWQEELSSMVTSSDELVSRLKLKAHDMPGTLQRSPGFPLRVTDSFVAKMQLGDWNDPLLRQVWPQEQELEKVSGYSSDPLNEKEQIPIKGIIHKYHGRVLLISQTQCAIHCRYCFRREFDYKENSPSKNEWLDALDYIGQDSSIEEVILSGGDPLVSSNSQLKWLIEHIGTISHVKTLRIHTRIPVVLPSRVDDELLNILSTSRLQKVVVIHSNHAQELDSNVETALERLASSNCTMLNQSVLLRGINNKVGDLVNLNKKLFSMAVLPYYLHLLDRVNGTAHFNISELAAKSLINGLREQLPGYLVPKLVKEQPNALSKTQII